MATYTDAIQKLYVAYFNRPADYEGLAHWEKVLTANNGNVDAVSAFFAASPEYKDQVAGKSNFQIVNQIYNNLFNRDADVTGLEFWAARLQEGTFSVDQIVKIIADNASDTEAKDRTTYLNKVAAATAFTAELNTAREIIGYGGDQALSAAKTWLSAVGDTASLNNAIAPANLQATVAAVVDTGLSESGEQYTLVKGLDTLNGTAGNDTFIGAVSTDVEVNTLSALDSINGGTGTDTLRVLTDGSAIDLPNVTAIEIIEAQSSDVLDIDTTGAAGVTTLSVTRANGDIDATAAATTDINVSLRDTAAITDISTNGGKNVTVKLTDAASVTDINNASGAVVVEKTAAAVTNTTTPVAMGAINVSGGTTINVTSNAGSSANLTAGGDLTTFAQGAIDIDSGAATTTINVKQTAASGGDQGAVAKAGATEAATVKFTKLDAGQTFTVGGLTFEASKNLTAAQVAQAFANLGVSAWAITAPQGDTQGPGVVANGVYSGLLPPGWTSGAASGDTVTFTAAKAGVMTNLTASAGTVTLVTDGADAVTGKAAAAAVTAGAVTIDAAAALKTVTVNGYSTGSISLTAAALDTISLANGAAFAIADTADTLGLTLEKVTGAITFGTSPTTLNVKSVGNNTIGNLAAGQTKALNVSGTGTLSAAANTLGALETIVVTETAGLNLGAIQQASVKSVNTTGTTGAVTVSVNGTVATYTGGAGADKVTIYNDAAITKAINLGAGADRLDLSALSAASLTGIAAANVLQGGDGAGDVIALSAAAAASVSGGALFEARINGFDKLEVGAATSATTVNLDNVDDINYVITNGSSTGAFKLDQMQANATVEIKARHIGANLEVALKDASGEADVLNVIVNGSVANQSIATVAAADIETINVTVAHDTIRNTLYIDAQGATTVNLNNTGTGTLQLILQTASTDVTLIDASTATTDMWVNLYGHEGSPVTVKGGSGDDRLIASVWGNSQPDVLIGGAGDDELWAGTNGTTMTGGAGRDNFAIDSNDPMGGTKEANTYATVTDFTAEDILTLYYWDNGAASGNEFQRVSEFAKLTATLNPSTAVFTDYVNAAMAQAMASGDVGQAVWFMIGSDAYVVVDSGDLSSGSFTNGEDLIIKLTGVNLNNASFNEEYGTVALV